MCVSREKLFEKLKESKEKKIEIVVENGGITLEMHEFTLHSCQRIGYDKVGSLKV